MPYNTYTKEELDLIFQKIQESKLLHDQEYQQLKSDVDSNINTLASFLTRIEQLEAAAHEDQTSAVNSLKNDLVLLVDRVKRLEDLHAPDPDPTPTPDPDPTPTPDPDPIPAVEAVRLFPPDSFVFQDNFLPNLASRKAIPEALADLELAADEFPQQVLRAIVHDQDTTLFKAVWLKKARDTQTNDDDPDANLVVDWGSVKFCDSDDYRKWAQLLTWLWLKWTPDEFPETLALMKQRIDAWLVNDRPLIRRWWDNDVHGRSAHMMETLVVAKALAMDPTDAWALERMNHFGSGASGEELYSPYKIASTLNARAQESGGIQEAGKHYDAGWGDGYEGMYVRNPWVLMNLWHHCTGDDLLSRCTAYTKCGEAAYFRHKNYWKSRVTGRAVPIIEQCGGSYGKLVLSHVSDDANIPARELLFLYKDYETLPAQEVTHAFRVASGDGYIHSRKNGVEIDVTATEFTRGGQRSEFKPRTFAFTKNDKGLLWTHGFKGGLGARSANGIMIGENYPMHARALDSHYYPESARPNGDDEDFQAVYSNPEIHHTASGVLWTEDWTHRINNSVTRERLGNIANSLVSTYHIIEGEMFTIDDDLDFKTPQKVRLSFTCSDVPSFTFGPKFVTFVLDTVRVTLTSPDNDFELERRITNQPWLGSRDSWPLDYVYDPYNLGIIKEQFVLTFTNTVEKYKIQTVCEALT